MAKVFLGIGHGGSDPGAVANNFKESELNLKQGVFVEKHLKRHGVDVLLSRRKEENDVLSEEIKECNAYKPDLAVDLHTNAGGGNGFEVIHSIYTTGNSYKMANNINEEVKKTGRKSRGLKTRKNSSGRDYFGFIRDVNAPSVITEIGFIDNINDLSTFDEDHEIEAYAICVVKGLLKTLGITWKEIEVEKPIPEQPKPNDDKKTLYRVKVNGKQIGAFSKIESILDVVEENIEIGYISIEKV